MPQAKNKNICVIGGGYWGKNHIKALAKLNSLKGIVEIDINVLQSLKNIYPGVKGHLNIKDALAENYDGYVIATPAKTHFEIAKFFIENKQNVLIEKPMALSIEDSEELVKLVDENKLNVIGLWYQINSGLIKFFDNENDFIDLD